MRVAVPIPDALFCEAELLAKRLQTTRSDLYARALDAFIGAYAPDRVIEAMNEVVDVAGPASDAFAGGAMRQVLDRVDW